LSVVCIVVILLATLLTQGGYLLYKHVLMEPYVQNEATVLDRKNTGTIEKYKETLAGFGVDISIPCIPEGGVVVSLLTDLKGAELSQEIVYPTGTLIEIDFFNVPYGGVTRNTRRLEITVQGEKHGDDVQVDPNDLLDIYMTYIESNQLESEFEQTTGKKFNRGNAKDALFVIDKRCYQQGVTQNGYYPINTAAADVVIKTSLFALPVIIVVVFVLLDALLSKSKQDKYWKEWYRGNKARHDMVQLPQFRSLNGKK